MGNLELKCKDLISYLCDSIDENQIEHIKNVFANIGKDIGDSIYPQFKRVGDCEITEGGLSKLDYFAGKALVGLLADVETDGSNETFAKCSYAIAEAMIKESNKRQQ